MVVRMQVVFDLKNSSAGKNASTVRWRWYNCLPKTRLNQSRTSKAAAQNLYNTAALGRKRKRTKSNPKLIDQN